MIFFHNNATSQEFLHDFYTFNGMRSIGIILFSIVLLRLASAIEIPSEGVYWTRQGDNFTVYVDGNMVTDANMAVVMKDILLYLPESHTTLLLNDFYDRPDDSLFTAEVLSDSISAFWYRKDELFWLISRGEYVQDVTAHVTGNDAIIFDRSSKAYYVLEGYQVLEQGQLHPAVFYPGGHHAFWFRDARDLFMVFEAGLEVNDLISVKIDDDLLAYSPSRRTTYLLKGYYLQQQEKVHTAEVLSRVQHTFWRRKGEQFWIYDKGETLILDNDSYSFNGDDLICRDKAGRIITLTNYLRLDDNALRIAVVR